jgi:putative transposase
MDTQCFIKGLYQSIVKENGAIYQNLFSATNVDKVKDDYWKEALRMYSELSDENKAILFKIIEQVQVDTVSNVLGILDGVVSLPEQEIKIKMSIEGTNESMNGVLQDLFLEYVEENR